MATWQFYTHPNPDGSVVIPPDVASQLNPEDAVRVVISTDIDGETSEWQRLTAEQFLQGYGPGDEIYDDLSSR